MDKYISREALDNFFDREIRLYEPCPDKYDAAVELKGASHVIPAVEARPVVLCRDCVYLQHDEHGAWCFNNYEANLKDDDFCSHGKRKEK